MSRYKFSVWLGCKVAICRKLLRYIVVPQTEDEVDRLTERVKAVVGEGGRQYRGDTLSDINSGLSVLSGVIRIVSTVLTILGAESVDRCSLP